MPKNQESLSNIKTTTSGIKTDKPQPEKPKPVENKNIQKEFFGALGLAFAAILRQKNLEREANQLEEVSRRMINE